MSNERKSIGETLVEQINALNAGETVTINFSELIRQHVDQYLVEAEEKASDEYSPYNTVNS
jgi:hypothetical protein